jgi:hypothetical protein
MRSAGAIIAGILSAAAFAGCGGEDSSSAKPYAPIWYDWAYARMEEGMRQAELATGDRYNNQHLRVEDCYVSGRLSVEVDGFGPFEGEMLEWWYEACNDAATDLGIEFTPGVAPA